MAFHVAPIGRVVLKGEVRKMCKEVVVVACLQVLFQYFLDGLGKNTSVRMVGLLVEC
jgi:hypothetical protein